MQYHLVMTQRCNLNCSYCGSSVNPEIMPVDLSYEMADLQVFLSKLDDPPVLAFYGGEPCVNAAKIMEIMDYIPAAAFMLQTNGTLLHRLKPAYIPRFHSILISIDGRPEITDAKRGQDVQDRALRGARFLREKGFEGDLIARMTVTQASDIYQEVMYLLDHANPAFDHVHWQLDVMWDTYFEEDKEEITNWLLHEYNRGITKLIQLWVERIEQNLIIPGIVPFMGIMHTLLSNEEVGLRCGAGKDFFSITTDGRVTICPILPSISFATVGSIYNGSPASMVDTIQLETPCTSCDVKSICGGRCIYTNKTKHWGDEGFALVCETVKHLIHELQKVQPRIEEIIRQSDITIDDFNYPTVPNGVEIIP